MKHFSNFVLVLVLGVFSTQLTASDISVAVASNFTGTLEKLAKEFEKLPTNSGSHKLVITSGSSGKFYTQIKEGAPFDLFLSADAERPALLVKDDLADKSTLFTYAIGRLALWSTKPNLVDADGKILNASNVFAHIAIASPKAAPYGLAAQQVMTKLNAWDKLQSKLVQGENIAQTFQFVESGAAELGFVALSQLLETGKRAEGSCWEVPVELHAPIEQQAVMIKSARNPKAVREFIAFLKSEKARAIITATGYILPAPEKAE